MDPVLKAYADQGVLALSFGILLIGAIWVIKYLLTSAAEERKAWGAVLQQISSGQREVADTLTEVKTAMGSITNELRDLSRRMDGIEREVKH